jgi:hypothetical protein
MKQNSNEHIIAKGRIIFIIFLLLPFFCSYTAFSQQLSGDIETYVTSLINDLPGSDGNDYSPPSGSDLLTWGNSITALLNNDLVTARQQAGLINYQIIEYEDNTLSSNNHYYILQEKTLQSKYWGTYIFSIDPLRQKLIIQTPHPRYDSNTGYQGIYCFKRLAAGALFISGTHRCNNTSYSSCSGTSSSCGDGYNPYRVSDPAHNVNSTFQKSTEIVLQMVDGSVFVQLHGFAKGDDDPYAIMSNGTRVTPTVDYLSLLKEQLSIADPGLTFKIANIDRSWSRLIAFTNTQGRLINNSSNPCTQNATNSEGRFLHIEQEKTRLRGSSSAWSKMEFALANVFEVDTASVGYENKIQEYDISIYPNPTRGRLYIQVNTPSKISLFSLNGKQIKEIDNIKSEMELDISENKPGVYFLRIESQFNVSVRKVVLL